MSDTAQVTMLEKRQERLSALLLEDAPLAERKAEINDVCRGIVEAMHKERGQAWLGIITPQTGKEQEPVLRLWNGVEHLDMYSGCSFVLPARDPVLVTMIETCRSQPYRTPSEYIQRLTPIMARINELEGVYLTWV